jgi:hypothetical protein
MVETPTKLGNIYQLADGRLFEADTPSKLLEIQEAPQRIGQPQEYIINGQPAKLIKRQLWTKRITIIPGVTGFRLQLLTSRLEREAVLYNSFHKPKKLSKEAKIQILFEGISILCQHKDGLTCKAVNELCCQDTCPELKKPKKRKRKEVLPLPCEFQDWNSLELGPKHALCTQVNKPCGIDICPTLLNDLEYQAKAKAKATRKPRARASNPMDEWQISSELDWLSEQGYCDTEIAFYQDLMLKGTYTRP